MKTLSRRALALLPALAIAVTFPIYAHASEVTAKAESAIAEVRGDAAKAALKDLDIEIDRVDAMIDNAPTDADKAAAKARMDVLKERRSELRKSYAQARYDELKADIRAEASRVGAWTKRTFTKDPAEKAADEARDAARDAKKAARDAGNTAYANVNTLGTAVDIAAYKMRPTDTNKEEAKAALKALNQNIDQLEDRIDNMPKGEDRDAAKRRLKALEDRKDELESDFNKARFDSLVDDVQREWHDFVN